MDNWIANLPYLEVIDESDESRDDHFMECLLVTIQFRDMVTRLHVFVAEWQRLQQRIPSILVLKEIRYQISLSHTLFSLALSLSLCVFIYLLPDLLSQAMIKIYPCEDYDDSKSYHLC